MGPLRARDLRARGLPFAVLCLVVALMGAMPHAGAQDQLSCLNCDMELVTLEWNGSANPGGVTSGLFEVRNTGESRDSYTITASADNDTWTVETDPTETNEVPPGSGLFAEENNAVSFNVRVLVPADAPANSKVTITVRAASQNAEDLSDETTVEARAKQVYEWTLDCTPFVSIQKTKDGEVTLTAENRGNGRDRAEIAFTPVEGLVPDPPAAFEAAAGRTIEQTLSIGAGLRADDTTYQIRWDLRSGGDPNALAQCTTAIEVTGGDGTGDDGDGDETEDSPAPGALLVLLLLVCARSRKRSS